MLQLLKTQLELAFLATIANSDQNIVVYHSSERKFQVESRSGISKLEIYLMMHICVAPPQSVNASNTVHMGITQHFL